jgi:MinD-like ATPase involved in chromosome partitioning or flagellar assembly
MKTTTTISIHSYKGGTGRTMTAVQLAVVLARLRKSSFVIDLDLDAPGLFDRFQTVFEGRLLGLDQGLVEHADLFRRTGEFVDVGTYSSVPHPKIRVFPAGNAFHDLRNYWRTWTSSEFQEFLKSGRGIDYFTQLKKYAEETLKVDFLIIDAPSGISWLTGIAQNFLSEIAIVLTTYQPESLKGSNFFARQAERRRLEGDKSEQKRKYYYVLSRFPSYYWDEKGLTHYDEDHTGRILDQVEGWLRSGITQPAYINRPHIFYNEPKLQASYDLVLPLEGPPIQSALASNYIDFFSVLIPDLSEELAKLRRGIQVMRPFYLVSDDGQMINPEDQSWNVAFRVDTLVGTLDSIFKKISAATEPKQAQAALFDSGYSAAEEFSEYLRKHWAATLPVKFRLDEWCDFDSKVGFGRFYNELAAGETAGAITIVNNFLIAGPKTDSDLCSFMTGYITRVLETIYDGKSVGVKHNVQTDCGRHQTATVPQCVFRFEVAA